MPTNKKSKTQKQKRILLKYYSARNFGDDFFVKIAADYLKDYQLVILGNPLYKIKNLPSNTKFLFFASWALNIIGKVLSLCENKLPQLSHLLINFINKYNNHLNKKFDAQIMIGGSIFMQPYIGQNEIDFTLDKNIKRDFSIKYKIVNSKSKEFIIGSNFGPYYDEHYRNNIESLIKTKSSVSMRDYSSYNLFKHLDNVQYAPDVVFLHTPDKIDLVSSGKKRAFISVIQPQGYDANSLTFSPLSPEIYYKLVIDCIKELSARGFAIDLVSFCDKEGDMEAINHILKKIDSNNIEVHSYSSDADFNKILNLVARSSYVIASRFHSMILGFIYGKPTFPIAYNCKTVNYIADLNFEGKYASYKSLDKVTVDDALYNYNNNILCDIKVHQKYAKNQFYALERFLNNKFDK